MGHIVLNVEKLENTQWFFQDVLGFKLSDYMLRPFKAYFFLMYKVGPGTLMFSSLST